MRQAWRTATVGFGTLWEGSEKRMHDVIRSKGRIWLSGEEKGILRVGRAEESALK